MPGESLFFTINIENKSSNKAKITAVEIIQRTRFNATAKTRTELRTVAKVNYPKIIPPGLNETLTSSLVIPPVCSTSNGLCRIIEVSYEATLRFGSTGVGFDKSVIVPVVVGTVPLMQVAISAQDAKAMGAQVPSYEACMFGVNQAGSTIPNDLETKGEFVESDAKNYKPLYPYFKDLATA